MMEEVDEGNRMLRGQEEVGKGRKKWVRAGRSG